MTRYSQTGSEHYKALRKQLDILQKLPDDFRNIIPGTQQWMDFYEHIPERRETMDAWLQGTVIHCGPISQTEKHILGNKRTYIYHHNTLEKESVEDMWDLILEANMLGYTLMYLRELPGGVVRALNTLCSHAQLNIRLHSALTNQNGLKLFDKSFKVNDAET